jgi:transcriptional regulator with XRE-family HTH domain
MSDDMTSFSRRVRGLRSAAGLTQQQLATAAGLSVSLVAQLEQGTTGDPKLSTATALAEALGVSLDVLAGRQAAPGDTGQAEAPEPRTKARAAGPGGKKRKGK